MKRRWYSHPNMQKIRNWAMVSTSHYAKIRGSDDGICIKIGKENQSGNAFHIKNMKKLMLQMGNGTYIELIKN